jgi:hypothetical protein
VTARTDPTPAQLAQAAADAIHALAHATQGKGPRFGLTGPADVYAVLGGLDQVAAVLPEVLRQLSEWLAAERAAGRVGHDLWEPEDGGAAPTLARVTESLRSAVRCGGWLAAEVADAREQAAHLTGPPVRSPGARGQVVP